MALSAKLHRVNSPVWAARFKDPIDKRWTYVKEGEQKAYFGAARQFMGGEPAVNVNINWTLMTVCTPTR